MKIKEIVGKLNIFGMRKREITSSDLLLVDLVLDDFVNGKSMAYKMLTDDGIRRLVEIQLIVAKKELGVVFQPNDEKEFIEKRLAIYLKVKEKKIEEMTPETQEEFSSSISRICSACGGLKSRHINGECYQ